MKIIHLDMDAFYASVEQRDDPSLKGKPVVVGGSPKGRGVVATASYEARKFGIHSAMPTAQAYRLCPQAIFLKPNFSKYKEASRQIRAIFQEVTDLIEPLSLDEAFLDVTENKLNEPSATKLAKYLKSRIKGSLGLTASAGVAPVKFVAKIASDFKKPDGLTVVEPDKVLAFLDELPIQKMWSVGPVTASKLIAMGIERVGDLRKKELSWLSKKLGKHGAFLWNLAHGRDSRQVHTERNPKSCGSERTFGKDQVDLFSLLKTLKEESIRVSESLQKKEKQGRRITLKVRYSDFETITRSRTLSFSTNDGEAIFHEASDLLTQTEAGRRAVRLVGVSVSDFGLKQLHFPFFP